jgi:hypothetical protein
MAENLTGSQREQLRAFLNESDADEDRVRMQAPKVLSETHVEAVLLDEAGQPRSAKRILFP